MIKKIFKMQFKELKETNKIAEFIGYASTFGNVDLENDIIEKGAFLKSLKEKGMKYPILIDHSARIMTQAGWNIEAKEDEKGLMVKGELNLEVEAGRTAYSLIKQAKRHGAEMGLSVGFMVKDFEIKDEIRIIKEIDLFEYSIVVIAANPMAGVTSVKDLKDRKEISLKKREIEHLLRDVGCSKSQAQKAISSIFYNELEEFVNILKL